MLYDSTARMSSSQSVIGQDTSINLPLAHAQFCCRDLARFCRSERSEEGEESKQREASWFIAVVAGAFDQTDLADAVE